MPSTQLTNPLGAFGEPYSQPYSQGIEYIEAQAAVAITAGQLVGLEMTSGVLQAVVGTVALAPTVYGVALDTVVAGQVVRIQINGIATVVGAGALAIGAIVSPAAAGQITSASATIGSNIGTLLTTISGAGVSGVIAISKM